MWASAMGRVGLCSYHARSTGDVAETRAKHGCRVWCVVVAYEMSASSVEAPRCI